MESPGGVVVEFVGLPATGKTHVAEAVKERIVRGEWGGDDDDIALRTSAEKRNVANNRFNALWYITTGFARRPMDCFRTASTIHRSDQPSIGYELRYLGYLLYVVEEIRRARKNGEIYLVDQGFFQHLWRIYLTAESNEGWSLIDLAETYLDFVDPDIVVFVSVDHHTRMERAMERGTSVDPELFDPDHALITDDQEAYEDVRTFVPMMDEMRERDVEIIDIENAGNRLHENVNSIVRAIRTAREEAAGLSPSSNGNPQGAASDQ